MIRNSLLFRTRSGDRDQTTDASRRSLVKDVVEVQCAEITKEIAGLTQRMNRAYLNASALLDASSHYSERSDADESEITSFERSASTARERIKILNDELSRFTQILKLL